MIIIVRLAKMYVNKFPKIKRKIRTAHMSKTPEQFVSESFRAAAFLTVVLVVLAFFIFDTFNVSFVNLVWVLFGALLVFFWFMMHRPDVYIRRRQRDMEKEVLFAGRFILVKIESGQPFFNALTDASNARGIAGKYFMEIVEDVNLGTPIEEALENAIEYSPSERFRRILMQITNSLKTGIDVADTLRSILKQITEEQIIEIKEYGKKLSSMAMFYMLIGVVVPALLTTMFIIISSFIGLEISFTYLLFAAGMLAFMQFIFISLFKSIRPMVNI